MVGGLAAVLDLAQGDGGVGGGFPEHLAEEVRRHKVGASILPDSLRAAFSNSFENSTLISQPLPTSL